jgi:hypothetical protein
MRVQQVQSNESFARATKITVRLPMGLIKETTEATAQRENNICTVICLVNRVVGYILYNVYKANVIDPIVP